MVQSVSLTPRVLETRLEDLVAKIAAAYPKTVLLFGSAVSFLEDPENHAPPNDLDVLLVCDNPLMDLEPGKSDPQVELHRFRTETVTAIARSLRYDTRAMALSKLYAKNVAAQHARDVILAAMLLGPDYNAFGIQQIEIEGLTDSRDYSKHRVLYGNTWWQRLTAWSRERRTFFQRMADKMISRDRF